MISQAGLLSTDVVLLLAGTNNVIAGDSAETMLAKMDVLLEQIVCSPESPDVMLMNLQYVGGDWWADGDTSRTNNETIRIFNESLATLVANYEGVTLVENGTTEADLCSDGIHLSEAGYRKTADAWFDALMAGGDLEFGTSRPQLTATTARESGATNGATLLGAKKADKLTGTSVNDNLD
jgi:lysophospholipase L1-like esterase